MYTKTKCSRSRGSEQPFFSASLAATNRVSKIRRMSVPSWALSLHVAGILAVAGCAPGSTLHRVAPAGPVKTDRTYTPSSADRRHLVRVTLTLPSSGASFADVVVRVDKDADPILEVVTPGEELWLGLKPGSYVVRAVLHGKSSIAYTLNVPVDGRHDLHVEWLD